MSKKSHHFLMLWPWSLTYDLEKFIRSGHYHYQCVYQIWEQSILWFLSYRVNTIAGGGRLRRKTITSPDPSDTGDIITNRCILWVCTRSFANICTGGEWVIKFQRPFSGSGQQGPHQGWGQFRFCNSNSNSGILKFYNSNSRAYNSNSNSRPSIPIPIPIPVTRWNQYTASIHKHIIIVRLMVQYGKNTNNIMNKTQREYWYTCFS